MGGEEGSKDKSLVLKEGMGNGGSLRLLKLWMRA
jgi:hypothetical protein